MKIRHIDHIGINVNNLDSAKTFFLDLGFTIDGEAKMEGELLDKVIGINNAKTEFVMLKAPDGQLNLEIIKYHQPIDTEGIRTTSANTLGMRHIAFQVEDLDEILDALTKKGYQLVGEVQTYENIWKLCYIRGPEGLIVELAEKLQ